MMITTVKCDHCQADITSTGNSIGYRLDLNVEVLPTDPDISWVTDMVIYPPLNRDHHFCGLLCLKLWLQSEEGK